VLPLEGVRVIDLTRLLPGAYATHLLGGLGADVTKIEDPNGGDGMRRFGPYFDRLNRGKRSVTLNLRSPDARAVLDALLARADIIVESFRPAAARRLGVDAATLGPRHPRLICASLNGFGSSGPRLEVAAHDINYQALAGLLHPPERPGALIGDVGAALQMALAIVAALVERHRTGKGTALEVSIYEAARAWTKCPTTRAFESACYTLYETADGEWLAVGALEPKFWRQFCERIARPDFVELQHVREVPEIRALMRSRRRDEWLALFEGCDACVTPVLTPDRAGDDRSSAPAPSLGADTDAALEAAGIPEAARTRLRDRGVI